MLCSGELLQASILDCDAFDPICVTQNFLSRVRVDVGRGEVVQALVIAAMVVVVDEGGEFRLPLFQNTSYPSSLTTTHARISIGKIGAEYLLSFFAFDAQRSSLTRRP